MVYPSGVFVWFSKANIRLTIDNQQKGLETQAKVSMLLTRHP